MRTTTVALLIALGVAVFALWFFNTHHKVSEDEYVGPHGEARFNDHLAARLLFKELHLDAESMATLTPTEWLPDVGDTLFVRVNASLALGDEQAALLGWVANGGNLILLPPRQSVLDTDRFLNDFGFSLVELEEREEPEAAIEDATDTTAETNVPRRNSKSTDGADEYMLANWRNAGIELDESQNDFTVVRAQDRIAAARRDWGDGYVTLFSEDFFTNADIGELDNGRLLLDVVAGDIEPNKIWMIYQVAFTPLWELIWISAPYLVLGLLIVFLLCLWAAMPTFGPRVVAVVDSRRSIIEHISAAGVFVWRNDGGETLARSATEALIDQAESRHMGIGRQTPQRQAEIIAHVTGMSAQKVIDILTGPDGHRPKDFIHNMQKLQSIRKQL